MPIVSQPKSSEMRKAAIYILHCSRICASVSLGRFVAAGVELHTLGVEPSAHLLRLGVAYLAHCRIEPGLAEALLEDTGRVEEMVGDDGVVHPHATLVENAQDGFVLL